MAPTWYSTPLCKAITSLTLRSHAAATVARSSPAYQIGNSSKGAGANCDTSASQASSKGVSCCTNCG